MTYFDHPPYTTLAPGGTDALIFDRVLFRYRPFVRKDFAVAAGQFGHLDIELSEGLTATTLGELPALLELYSKRPPPPKGPVPRMPDGKPDLSWVWMTPPSDWIPVLSQPSDLQPWAEAQVRERLLNGSRDKPSARCLPDNESTGIFVGLFPVKIVQTRALLVALIVDVIAAHQVFLDGRGHPSDQQPTWMGHSIGKWDGDTLVIDTVGFNDKSWMFVVTPHTEKLHVITRLNRLKSTRLFARTINTRNMWVTNDAMRSQYFDPDFGCLHIGLACVGAPLVRG